MEPTPSQEIKVILEKLQSLLFIFWVILMLAIGITYHSFAEANSAKKDYYEDKCEECVCDYGIPDDEILKLLKEESTDAELEELLE
jgi:hypothetical protein